MRSVSVVSYRSPPHSSANLSLLVSRCSPEVNSKGTNLQSTGMVFSGFVVVFNFLTRFAIVISAVDVLLFVAV